MVQWIDVNQSLERLCGPKFEKNPWSDRIMTVTTKMLLVKRGTIKTGDGVSFSQFKLMDGVELMHRSDDFVLTICLRMYRGCSGRCPKLTWKQTRSPSAVVQTTE